MPTEREVLAKTMQQLADKGRELAEEHARVVAEFLEVQQRITDLDRREKEKSN